jgi:hypothetical protein
MMKILKNTIKCDYCGCVSLPDSRSCPKCGNSYIVKHDESYLPINNLEKAVQMVKIPELSNSISIRLSFIKNSHIDVDILSIYN